MAKAVIALGGSQHLVSEGDTFSVNKISDAENKKKIEVTPLMVVDGASSKVGAPDVKGAKVTLSVVQAVEKDDKVTAIRYKSKKRVHKRRGHRQQLTTLKVDKIA